MKQPILMMAVTAMTYASVSYADIIQCTFSEPFVTTVYSMAQQSLTITNDVTQGKQVIKNVSFQIKGPNKFEIVDKDGKVLQTLKLTGKGTHGMGGAAYPYEVKDSSMENNANKGVGGCSSNYLKEKTGKY